MRHVLVEVLATLVLIIVAAVATLGITDWAMARRFVAGDAHAIDGIVRTPLNEPLVLLNVTIWEGRGGIARLLLRRSDPMQQWARWYEHSPRNTEKLYRAGVSLIFGTDTRLPSATFSIRS